MGRRKKKIAIIGHACRFPGGADSPEKFWELLISGTDAVSEVPADRFDQRRFLHPDPTQHGKSYTFAAGTIGDVSGFDASFFGISAREAPQIDPQQRLLLELTQEAIERAGLAPSRLAGTDCAVYVGISGSDYAERRMGDLESMGAHFMLGATLSIAANRISYAFDLRGPSLAVDTACSSSLVAFSEAVDALQDERASMAVVGGVNLLLGPSSFVGFSRAGMLSPSGRSRAFGKNADGYVRAEGGGVVILKPLSDAKRDGDPVLATICGVGVNSDGRTRGIALPSEARQEELLREVYRKARIAPNRISYFEAHGTGTAIGDPIEASAIGNAIGTRRRRREPLLIGSAKSNVGHLEPAAGMAGAIKSIEILQHGVIPASLHLEEPNPEIPFEKLNLAPVKLATLLPNAKNGIVGINSFGFGGTNAHLALEAYNRAKIPPTGINSRLPFVVSGRTAEALSGAVSASLAFLKENPELLWRDITFTSCVRREHYEHRLILRANDANEAASLLREYQKKTLKNYHAGTTVAKHSKTALVFVGNGSQWSAMGVALLKEDSVFRETVTQIDRVARWRLGWSLLETMESGTFDVDDTELGQPLIFALQVGLVESLKSRGLEFDAVVGHSVGEVAAAYVSGALSLEHAVHLVKERSLAQAQTRGYGRMLAVSLSEEAASAEIALLGGQVEIAAINGPNAVTLSGDATNLHLMHERFEERGIVSRLLALDYAFHSATQDQLQDSLMCALESIEPRIAKVPFYSTVSGGHLEGSALNASYWWRNVREKVQFESAIVAMANDGYQIFLEVGPQPQLQGYIRRILGSKKKPGQPISTLAKTDAGFSAIERVIDQAFGLGSIINFEKLFPERGEVIPLPTYPWQREKHWYSPSPEAGLSFNSSYEGTLLGLRTSPDVPIWEMQFDVGSLPFLADHIVDGLIVVPAAAYVEMTLEAGKILFPSKPIEIENIEVRRPLIIQTDAGVILRFSWSAEDCIFQIKSRPRLRDSDWLLHVTGRLTASDAIILDDGLFLTSGNGAVIKSEDHYAFAARHGFSYGPSFTVLKEVFTDGHEAIADLTLSNAAAHEATDYCLHPALFDGALQAIFAILNARSSAVDDNSTSTFIPHKIESVVFCGAGIGPYRAKATLKSGTARVLIADCVLQDSENRAVAHLRGIRLSKISRSKASRSRSLIFNTNLEPLPSREEYSAPAVPWMALCNSLKKSSDLRKTQKLQEVLDLVAEAVAADALIELGDEIISSSLTPLLTRLVSIVDASTKSAVDWDIVWKEAIQNYPELLAELTVLGLAGQNLAGFFAGKKTSLGSSAALLDHLFDSAPLFAESNAALVNAVIAFASAWPQNKRLRILIFGAHLQTCVRNILANLPSGTCEVTLIDDSELDLDEVAKKAGVQNDIRVIRSDLQDSEEFAQNSFDIIIGIHVSRKFIDQAVTLKNLASWSALGASVLFTEFASSNWADIALGDSSGCAGLPPLLETVKAVSFDDAALYRCGAANIVAAKASSAICKAEATKQKHWVLFAGDLEKAFADELCTALAHRGQRTSRIAVSDNISWEDSAFWKDYWNSSLTRHGLPDGFIHLAGLLKDGDTLQEILAIQNERCLTLLAAISGLRSVDNAAKLSMCLVTHAAFPVPGATKICPAQAPLAGIGRVLQNEHPELFCRILDIHGVRENLSSTAAELARELLTDGAEIEVVLADDSRFAPRLHQVSAEVRPLDENQIEILRSPGGLLKNLHWVRQPKVSLEADEIEVEVKAAGLNYRDVMFAMGALPEEILENGFAGPNLGMEAAGVVSRIGSGIGDVSCGDRVVCFAPASLSTHTITRRFAIAKLPIGMDFLQGATLTTAFFTITYALKYLAKLSPNEKILIHGAAGGVGIAAIQYAQSCDAEIFATAGTEEKRGFLRLLGIDEDHILDSRSNAFSSKIMASTAGKGVDVVLNSIAGEAVHRSLSLLKPFGRFIELGKADFVENARIGLRVFRNNVAYHGVDSDQVLAVKPKLARVIFEDMIKMFEDGIYTPLPYRTFPRDQVEDAFRHMQRSNHTGKIVIDMERKVPREDLTLRGRSPIAIDPAAIYIVSGGVSGLGLASAQWLAGKGARHLILVSRNGVASGQAESIIESLQKTGVTIEKPLCDVADEVSLDALFCSLAEKGKPIKGIVHAAAVFDDALIADQTPDRFFRVLGPKVAGGWALHIASLKLDLDLFVCISSISAAIGNPGQANYVAANLFLESLVAFRRSLGLAAQLVALGPIADTGHLTKHPALVESFSTMGLRAMSAQEVLEKLDDIILSDSSGNLLVDANWNRLRALLPGMKSRKFSSLFLNQHEQGELQSEDNFASLSRSLPRGELHDRVQVIVTKLIAEILHISPDNIEEGRSVFELGMDSLMGLELRMSIEEKIGIGISPLLLSQDIGVRRIAELICDQILGVDTPNSDTSVSDPIAAEHDYLLKRHGEDISVEIIADAMDAANKKHRQRLPQ